jgi:hypothetical protein
MRWDTFHPSLLSFASLDACLLVAWVNHPPLAGGIVSVDDGALSLPVWFWQPIGVILIWSSTSLRLYSTNSIKINTPNHPAAARKRSNGTEFKKSINLLSYHLHGSIPSAFIYRTDDFLSIEKRYGKFLAVNRLLQARSVDNLDNCRTPPNLVEVGARIGSRRVVDLRSMT